MSDKNIQEKEKQNKINNKINTTNLFEITINLHRSVMEISNLDSKRENRIRFSDIERLIIYEEKLIEIELFDKISMHLIPKKPLDSKILVEKIAEYCKIFLGYDLIIENLYLKDFKKNYSYSKNLIFSYQNVYRRLFDMHEKQIKFQADHEYIYEITENSKGEICKINKISLQEIIYVVCSDNRKDHFELFLKDNSRYVYKVNNNDRNLIVTNILDIISEKSKNNENDILLLSYKPKIEYRINGFIGGEVDPDFENCLLQNLQKFIEDERLREKIIEDICMNFCLRSKKFKMNSIINKKLLQGLYEIIPNETNKIIQLQKAEKNFENNKIYGKKLSVVNHYLILIQSVIKIFHSENLISDLFDLMECNSSQIIFYNIFFIYKSLLPTSRSLNKEEIAQRKWMISSHFDNANKIKNILLNKIFDFKLKQKNLNFEQNNVRL
jgi:hypothetical protein